MILKGGGEEDQGGRGQQTGTGAFGYTSALPCSSDKMCYELASTAYRRRKGARGRREDSGEGREATGKKFGRGQHSLERGGRAATQLLQPVCSSDLEGEEGKEREEESLFQKLHTVES